MHTEHEILIGKIFYIYMKKDAGTQERNPL